ALRQAPRKYQAATATKAAASPQRRRRREIHPGVSGSCRTRVVGIRSSDGGDRHFLVVGWYGLAAANRRQCTIDGKRDGLLNETDRAVGKGELKSADMPTAK